jgi:predicted metal-dependent hydrolase
MERSRSQSELDRGLALIESGHYFEAHEVLEDVWRVTEPGERDFFQGLVHVAVAWYQAGRGRERACRSQLAKAERRLTRYRPTHRGLDVDGVLRQVATAAAAYPELARPRFRRAREDD